MNNDKGYPRPVLDRNGQNTPVPWVGGDYPQDGEWASVSSTRAERAELDKLCIVCGETLTDNFIYMMTKIGEWSNHAPTIIERLFQEAMPSPTWVHPKCGQIAATFCPHLKSAQYPAITQDGQKLTHQELADLARTDRKNRTNTDNS
jgi:hypothetical protein